MDKYYRLEQDLNNLIVDITKVTHRFADKSLKLGKPMAPDIEVPFVYNMEIDEDELDPHAEIALPDYDMEGPIFSKRLLETIQNAGVDNLEIFPAVICNEDSGEKIVDQYLAVNIIGLVACADMDASESRPLAGSHFFINLKVDPAKIQDQLLFRLAEQPSDIIIHGSIANAIKDGNFSGIVLRPV